MTTPQLAGFILLWISIGVEGVLLFLLYKQVALLYGNKDEGLPVGAQAPSLRVRDVTGKTLALGEMLTSDHNLLVFGSLGCSGCQTLLQDRSVGPLLAEQSVRGYFLLQDSPEADHGVPLLSRPEGSFVVVTTDGETFADYAVRSVPFAYMVTRTSTIVARGPVGGGTHALRSLCERAFGEGRPTTQTATAVSQQVWVANMDAHIALSILIGLAWMIIAFIALASLALGARLGREHVFSAPGVSRLGPRIGRRIAGTTFVHHGIASSLGDIVATGHPTLLLFVGRLGLEADLPHVRDILMPDLLRLATHAKRNLELAIFCQGPCDSLKNVLTPQGTVTFINTADDQLTQRLGVRVTPFALLVDQRATVLAKGIANNAEHLCHVVARGGQQCPSNEDLESVAHICQSSLTVHPLPQPRHGRNRETRGQGTGSRTQKTGKDQNNG